MNKRLQALLKAKSSAVGKMKALQAAADLRGDGVMTAEETTEFDGLLTEVNGYSAEIARLQAAIEAERSIAVPAAGGLLNVPDGASIIVGAPRSEQDPTRGFSSFGEFAVAVYQGSQNGARPDERLLIGAGPTTMANSASGADGGYLVPVQFATEIMGTVYDDPESLLSLTDNTPLSQANAMTFPKDETTPWGSDGVRAYWEAEGAQGNQTKPALGTASMRMHKLFALVPVTDELMGDASAITSWITTKSGESILWKANESIYAGSGAGQPLGMLKGGALVTVAKEAGQAAATLVVQNIANMVARMPAKSYRRAVWMINNDVIPQLLTMTLNGHPIYTPPGGLANAPFGTLLGRPIMPSQHCETLGTKGDIALVDWKMYRTITKAAGIETATSMHLWFDYGVNAFRATFRLDGQPSIAKPVEPAKGNNTLSPFVVLATRA